ncbi:replication protein RepA [Teichococcus oryzae]|uniref:Plasmid replication initiator n=1 Tax=Teichococcus oryzae TaxID=1608942 RepID=A0A5B2TEB4_9PROT|nr:replication protein RepA [Pseudoroseomonas oryzae]KAA2212454.1 plasmid replication initiator [Pseudoroseomonas oryzae]
MATVHSLIEAFGRQASRDLVEGRRGPRIVEAAASWAADEDIGTGYIHSGWCQTALPHRRPEDDAAIWKLETDSLTLLVEPGIRLRPDGSTAHVGVPFGSIARLILIYLQSEALRTGSRDVALGRSLRDFLGRLGISVGGKTTKLVREQADRISRCRLSFHFTRNGTSILVNQNIVDIAMFVDDPATGRDRRQTDLFVETARLSESFFQQLRQHAVPLDEAAIRHIRNSSMALDVYCWLAYRLHALPDIKLISWTALATQFGAGIKLRKHFKAAFTENLQLAQAVYRDAKVELTPDGLILHPSPPPVRKLPSLRAER